MKRLTPLLITLAVLSGGCTDDQIAVQPAPESGTTVSVPFSLEARVDTDTSLEPMTRATAYKEWLYNNCRVLILKREDTRWIVDATVTVLLDPNYGMWKELKLSDNLPPSAFRFELRPGDYRFVAVINWQAATWNAELVPGKVVADDADAALRTPPLIQYTVSTHPSNSGFRMLNREVFVAVAEVTVPKSEDLHGSGLPPVTLQAERRVAKFRPLLKKLPSPEYGFVFDDTQHYARLLFTSHTRPLPEGIDALGGMYTSDPGLYELPWYMTFYGNFHAAESGNYQMCQTNATVFSPFLFADPKEELPVTVKVVALTGVSGGDAYHTDELFERTLAASKIFGIVFRTTDEVTMVQNRIIDVVEACDPNGAPEHAATLFDAYFEWNAEHD